MAKAVSPVRLSVWIPAFAIIGALFAVSPALKIELPEAVKLFATFREEITPPEELTLLASNAFRKEI